MRRCPPVAILAIAVALATASPAAGWGTGPTEFGNPCVGNATAPGITAIGLDSGDYLPFPQNAGPWELRGGGPNAVIVSWKAQVAPGQGPLAQQLVAFRQMGESEEQLVGESAVETLVAGTNEFKTRIPIPEYALIGLRGPAATLLCEGASGEFTGEVEGAFLPGETRSFKMVLDSGVPAVAVAERDEDNDGYGDLTQDGCPDNSAFHGPCPFVRLENGIEEVRPNGILIRSWANVASQMQVSGYVVWRPLPRREAGSTKVRRQPKRTTVLEESAQSVPASTRAQFWVPLPRVVIRRLRQLSPDQHLNATLNLVVSGAPELEGRTMTKELHAKLPGLARAKASAATERARRSLLGSPG
jgi:hypothetical protein